jgi:hypothetical protein
MPLYSIRSVFVCLTFQDVDQNQKTGTYHKLVSINR